MKLCIFADVHGNYEALQKMLELEKDKVDLFLFAGDIFGYFYGQLEIIDVFMSMTSLKAIKGNHEMYFLSGKDVERLVDRYGSSYRFSLSVERKSFIENLPEKIVIELDHKKIGIFHGGPVDYLEQRIYPDTVIDKVCFDMQFDYLIVAHTHYQLIRKIGGMTIINPGSLGQPRDGKGFSYCLLDTKSNECDFKNVNVDIDNLLKQNEKYDSDKYVFEYLKKKYGR